MRKSEKRPLRNGLPSCGDREGHVGPFEHCYLLLLLL